MSKIVRVYSRSEEGDVHVSANFRVREFACADGSEAVFISDELVRTLQKIRDHFGRSVHINSAYRTASHNKTVGGEKKSRHLYGLAADITVDGVAPAKVADYAELLMDGGGIGRYKTFTHIDVRSGRSRWQG